MKFKTDDIVYYDDSKLIVISGFPASDHKGYSYHVLVCGTGDRTEVWESDLLSEEEFLND